MTLPDRDLVAFLQRHRAQPPAASPALEATMMALIAAESPPVGSQRWQLRATMALALSVVAYVGLPLLLPPRFPLTERAELALFLAETWAGSADSHLSLADDISAETTWLLTADAEADPLDINDDLAPAQLSSQGADLAP